MGCLRRRGFEINSLNSARSSRVHTSGGAPKQHSKGGGHSVMTGR